MDPATVRAAFDDQLRRNLTPGRPGETVELEPLVTRMISDSWAGITWSGLDEVNADDAIATEIARFAELGCEWEWKHYSGDEPADLPERLVRAGFTQQPPETVLIAELAELDLTVAPPAGIELEPVRTRADVARFVAVGNEVFGGNASSGDHDAIGQAVLAGLADRNLEAVVATADGVPIAAGRVEFHTGTQFASIWGGGTLEPWRRRGVFRALVAYRASIAAERGYRYLQVDALPASRPILNRLGFREFATTTPFTFEA